MAEGHHDECRAALRNPAVDWGCLFQRPAAPVQESASHGDDCDGLCPDRSDWSDV